MKSCGDSSRYKTIKYNGKYCVYNQCVYSVYILKVTHDLSKTYICDLGVAKIKYQATMTTASNAIGTYPYMAPEMFGTGHRSTAADVYSLGCLYIELFGERRVWEGITDGVQIMQKVCGSYNNPQQCLELIIWNQFMGTSARIVVILTPRSVWKLMLFLKA